MQSRSAIELMQQNRQNKTEEKVQEQDDDICSGCPKFFRNYYIYWYILLFIGIILFTILFPLSFDTVEYYEYGMKKHYNDLDTSKIYENGRYFIGVEYDFQTFPRTFQHESLSLAIFANGLEFNIVIEFSWRIKIEELPLLYEKFALTYGTQIDSRANSKIKNVAPTFSIDDYQENRPMVEDALHHALEDELRIIHIECPRQLFALLSIGLPSEIRTKNLEAARQTLLIQKQENEQKADLIRKNTELKVREIMANITIIQTFSQSEKVRIVEESIAEGNRTVSDMDSFGIQNFFHELGINDPEMKSYYIRLYTLEESF